MKAPFLRIEYTEKNRWHHIGLAGGVLQACVLCCGLLDCCQQPNALIEFIGTALPVPNSFPPSRSNPVFRRLPAQIPPRLAQNNPPSAHNSPSGGSNHAWAQITPGERDSGPCRVFTRKLTPLPPPLPHTVSSPPFNLHRNCIFYCKSVKRWILLLGPRTNLRECFSADPCPSRSVLHAAIAGKLH
jgi:hypothetical protein